MNNSQPHGMPFGDYGMMRQGRRAKRLLLLGRLELDLLVVKKDTLSLVWLGLTNLPDTLCKLAQQLLIHTLKLDQSRRFTYGLNAIRNRYQHRMGESKAHVQALVRTR